MYYRYYIDTNYSKKIEFSKLRLFGEFEPLCCAIFWSIQKFPKMSHLKKNKNSKKYWWSVITLLYGHQIFQKIEFEKVFFFKIETFWRFSNTVMCHLLKHFYTFFKIPQNIHYHTTILTPNIPKIKIEKGFQKWDFFVDT